METSARTRELVITRVFDAPPEAVWKAWTDPETVKRWWGPKFFTAPFAKIDLTVGGRYLMDMRGPDGKDYWNTGTYRQIVPLQKLEMTDSFSDEQGNIVPASKYGMSAAFPILLSLSVNMEKVGSKTLLTVRYPVFPDGPDFTNAKQGWEEQFDKLEEMLKPNTSKTTFTAEPGKNETVMTRTYDAPLEKVFKTYANVSLVPQWWGPHELTTTVEKMDIKPGGLWRVIQKDQQGNSFGFHGVYHDVTPPKGMVYTFEFEGMPGHIILESVAFEPLGGKTRMTIRDTFQSVEDRDIALNGGMQSAAIESTDRFAIVVEK